jgi:predicted phage baseplate assembly protein
MSGAWWGREAPPPQRPRPFRGTAAPILMPADRTVLLNELDGRAPYFVPEWTDRRAGEDAGTALRQLFGEQLEAVAQRFDRWPEKAFIEFLDIAGVSPLPGTPAEVLLRIEIADSAPQSVTVGAGFQVSARVAGADGPVVFETERTFYAAPGKIGELYLADGRTFRPLDPTAGFAPFGDGRSASAQLLIGLTTAVAPSQTLSLGIGVATPSGAPPPASAGAVAPLPVPPGPALVWEVLDGGWTALEVVRDETSGLVRGGIVELALPPTWRTGVPAGLSDAKSSRWLRLRIAYGRFAAPPQLTFIILNAARALGARSVLDEVPDPVPASGGRRLQLSQTPVVAGSLLLQVDDSGLQLAASDSDPSSGGRTTWTPVSDLSLFGPDDAVYEIDLASGQLAFGDGRHGRALPEGFRNVHANYQVESLVPGPIAADGVNSAITSLEFFSKVSNPLPVTGGGPTETTPQVMKRGPQEIRTRGRAVTVADYALLATRAQGADIARAFAVSGLHPNYPGRAIPGVVGVFVVPPDRGEGAPTPDAETLRAVAASLAESAAPAGVEVVAAAPRYQHVAVDTGVTFSDGVDVGASVRAVLQALDGYFHPLTGGEAGDGWPFGGTIRYVPLLRRILRIPGVSAVPRLNVTLDGIRKAACTDVPIAAYALLWPATHQVFVVDAGVAP